MQYYNYRKIWSDLENENYKKIVILIHICISIDIMIEGVIEELIDGKCNSCVYAF